MGKYVLFPHLPAYLGPKKLIALPSRSHAKNAHSNPVFSHYERSQLPYGSKKLRLGAESFRKFDACSLCNSTVREPCACPEGHIFCRECILESLLSQKKLIAAHQVAVARRAQDDEEARVKARSEARERVVRDFEKGQTGLGSARVGSRVSVEAKASVEDESRGTKRKFEFDASALERMAAEAEDAAIVKIEKELAESSKAKLPAFWLPSLAPQAGPAPIAEMKLETMCTAVHPPHPLSIKKLITVKFTPLPVSASTSATATAKAVTSTMCPSCSKELSNSIASVLNKECGHVCCKTCVEKIVRPAKQCPACDGRAKDKDLVELKRDGTGYAAAGGAEAKKSGTAFQ